MYEGNEENFRQFIVQMHGCGEVYIYSEDDFRDKFSLWGHQIYNDIEEKEIEITLSYSDERFGSWETFNKTVWKELKEKHPDWVISHSSPYKSVVWL